MSNQYERQREKTKRKCQRQEHYNLEAQPENRTDEEADDRKSCHPNHSPFRNSVCSKSLKHP